jgi:hypothetical protein
MSLGNAVAGVLGDRQKRFSVQGEAMQQIAQLEPQGKPGKVHCSADFFNLLSKRDVGKRLLTHWLVENVVLGNSQETSSGQVEAGSYLLSLEKYRNGNFDNFESLVQKTSPALKGMGPNGTLESDRVMMDLQDNHGDITSIQNSLSASFDNTEEFDWEAEMAMLLQSDTYFSDTGPTNTDFIVPLTLNVIPSDNPPARAQDVSATSDGSELASDSSPRVVLSA